MANLNEQGIEPEDSTDDSYAGFDFKTIANLGKEPEPEDSYSEIGRMPRWLYAGMGMAIAGIIGMSYLLFRPSGDINVQDAEEKQQTAPSDTTTTPSDSTTTVPTDSTKATTPTDTTQAKQDSVVQISYGWSNNPKKNKFKHLTDLVVTEYSKDKYKGTNLSVLDEKGNVSDSLVYSRIKEIVERSGIRVVPGRPPKGNDFLRGAIINGKKKVVNGPDGLPDYLPNGTELILEVIPDEINKTKGTYITMLGAVGAGGLIVGRYENNPHWTNEERKAARMILRNDELRGFYESAVEKYVSSGTGVMEARTMAMEDAMNMIERMSSARKGTDLGTFNEEYAFTSSTKARACEIGELLSNPKGKDGHNAIDMYNSGMTLKEISGRLGKKVDDVVSLIKNSAENGRMISRYDKRLAGGAETYIRNELEKGTSVASIKKGVEDKYNISISASTLYRRRRNLSKAVSNAVAYALAA
ncbi:MAG: hypothetical protein GXO64_00505 [Candidatus Micrarchaeota archaeon]|nr:hypothetical protein [Candidatus Micrarchaeota archaeon]